MNILITICGRVGSKGVKGKNTRPFLGYPLIYYSVASAFLFKEKRGKDHIDICVNSDGDGMLDTVRQYDLTCIKRPETLAKDDSPKIPSIKYSLQYMEEKSGIEYDFIIDLDITSPIRKAADIANALNTALQNADTDVVFSAVPARRNPYFNMAEKKNGKVQRVINASFITRQQAPEVYDMNASIYCYRRESLLHKIERSVFDGTPDVFLMEDTVVLDIDSEEDFALMEILGRHFFTGEYKELYDYVTHMRG